MPLVEPTRRPALAERILSNEQLISPMTLQQLHYIVALDTHRHMGRAAMACFITQPTLSVMLRDLEEELGVKLFDRSKKPIVPTLSGLRVVEQARAVLKEADLLRTIALEDKDKVEGELRIGIIPTLAPYLLPLFVPEVLQSHPELSLRVHEVTTTNIMDQLTQGLLDVGILALPLNSSGLRETPLFRERFLVYMGANDPLARKRYVLPMDIDPDRLWLLEEGHCLRTQVVDLCELRTHGRGLRRLEFASGSIGSLIRLVDAQGGFTVIPELAMDTLTPIQRQRVREFRSPAPLREIGMVTYRHFVKDRMLEALGKAIHAAVAPRLNSVRNGRVFAP